MIELAIENKGFLFIAYFIVLIVLILSIKRKNSNRRETWVLPTKQTSRNTI